MSHALLAVLSEHYGYTVQAIHEAPRQFVAETFIADTPNGSVFCKVVSKPLFIAKIITSLPALNAIYHAGFDALAYPLPTRDGAWYVMQDGVLYVVFQYIAAPQNYTYNLFTVGQLMGKLHQLRPAIDPPLKLDTFTFEHADYFQTTLARIIATPPTTAIDTTLKALITRYQAEIDHHYQRFEHLMARLRATAQPLVITHGDMGGNILVKSPIELYVIDWDDMMMAVPERDLWLLMDKPAFIEGYQSIWPDYLCHVVRRNYCVYARYFNDLVEYLAEVEAHHPPEHRQTYLAKLAGFFEGWIVPHLRRLK